MNTFQNPNPEPPPADDETSDIPFAPDLVKAIYSARAFRRNTDGMVEQVAPGCSGLECSVTDGLGSHQDYGRWNAHSGFFVGPHDINYETIVMATAMGERSASAPAVFGTATWTGSVVGVDISVGRFENRIEGDATMQLRDLSQSPLPHPGLPSNPNSLTITFTNVCDVTDARSYGSIEWAETVIDADGGFSTGGLEGHFYGPNHEEAAGTFEWRGTTHIVGAFGVKK